MNGTINLKKLSTKMLDAISTLNTDISNLTTSIPSQIKTNNQQTLATVEQNPEAASRAYAAGEYLVANGKLYKALNDIAQGDALQENINIEWVLLGDEINKIRGDLKEGAFKTVANNLTTNSAGSKVLDAYQGKLLNDKITTLNDTTNTLNNRINTLTAKNLVTPFMTFDSATIKTYNIDNYGSAVIRSGNIRNARFSFMNKIAYPKNSYITIGQINSASDYPYMQQNWTGITIGGPNFANFSMVISSNGEIKMYRYDNSSTAAWGHIRISASYIAK